MRWDESVRCVLPGAAGSHVVAQLRSRWLRARIYITMRAARLEWLAVGSPAGWASTNRPPRNRTPPVGAAEHFAADLHRQVLGAGGDVSHSRAILLPLAGARHDIT